MTDFDASVWLYSIGLGQYTASLVTLPGKNSIRSYERCSSLSDDDLSEFDMEQNDLQKLLEESRLLHQRGAKQAIQIQVGISYI